MCLYQFSNSGPDLPKFMRESLGIGICSECNYDPINNGECSAYCEIKLNVFNVGEDKMKSLLEKDLVEEGIV